MRHYPGLSKNIACFNSPLLSEAGGRKPNQTEQHQDKATLHNQIHREQSLSISIHVKNKQGNRGSLDKTHCMQFLYWNETNQFKQFKYSLQITISSLISDCI